MEPSIVNVDLSKLQPFVQQTPPSNDIRMSRRYKIITGEPYLVLEAPDYEVATCSNTVCVVRVRETSTLHHSPETLTRPRTVGHEMRPNKVGRLDFTTRSAFANSGHIKQEPDPMWRGTCTISASRDDHIFPGDRAHGGGDQVGTTNMRVPFHIVRKSKALE